ncbi:MAG: hypothetical protein K6G03_04070 [Lachnospiraceae bacterium]|nr:hypothetical protein [Lachnospiraceae bacterium]
MIKKSEDRKKFDPSNVNDSIELTEEDLEKVNGGVDYDPSPDADNRIGGFGRASINCAGSQYLR